MTSSGPWPHGPCVEITRRLDAAPERIYRAFSEPQSLIQWWGPKGFTIEELDFQPDPGGSYRVVLRAPDGSRFVHIGVFIEVHAPKRLVYTWRWVEGPLDTSETLVEIDLSPDGQGTIVHIRHSRFVDDAERDKHTGWTDSMDNLAVWLAEQQ